MAKLGGCGPAFTRLLAGLLATLFLLPAAVSTTAEAPGEISATAGSSGGACPDTPYVELQSYDNVMAVYDQLAANPLYKGYIKLWSPNQQYGFGTIPGVTGTYKDYFIARLTNESRGLHKPEVFFPGPPHGNEDIGVEANVYFAHWLLKYALDPACKDGANEGSTEWLRWLLDNREIYLGSSANPYNYNKARGDNKGRDMNREYDHRQCNVDSGGNQIDCGTQAIGLLRTVNAATIATFMQKHQIRVGADYHGGTWAQLYSFGDGHQGTTASSRFQSGRSMDNAPPDFHYLDNWYLQKANPYLGPGPNGQRFTASNTGSVYSQVGYNAGGDYLDGWYASAPPGEVADNHVRCPGPTCNNSPNGIMKGSDCDPNGAGPCKLDLAALAGTNGWTGGGVFWHSPETGPSLISSNWGSDLNKGWASYWRRFHLMLIDFTQPSTRWWPGTPANDSQVPVSTPVGFTWVVNGSMVADETQLFWSRTPDVMSDPAKKSAPAHVDFKDKDYGGTGWEGGNDGKTSPHLWKDSATFDSSGDWYVVARSKVDQIYGKPCTGTGPCGIIRPDLYGNQSYLRMMKERAQPGWSETIQGEDGPETMKYTEWWYSPVLHLKVGSDDVPPTVVSTSPAAGAVGVAPNGKIVTAFSEPMDKASAEAALSLAPAATGALSWDAAGSTMTLAPSADLAVSTQYTATVSTTAKDVAGNAMVAAKTWTFTTSAGADRDPPVVVSTDPAASATQVPPTTDVRVTFNESMDRPTAESAFSLAPIVAGTVSWPSAGALLFHPTSGLADTTTYTIRVSTAAKDLAGNSMTAEFTSTFTTGIRSGDVTPPFVQTVSPADQAAGVPTNSPIRVKWSEPVDPTSAQASFSIAPAAAGAFSWNGEEMTYRPAADLQPSMKHNVTVAPGTKDIVGNSMQSSYSFSFMTGNSADRIPPQVKSVTPLDAATQVPPANDIIVTFTEPIRPDMIAVDPAKGVFIGFDVEPAPLQGKGQGAIEIRHGGSVVFFTPKASGIGLPGLADNTRYTVRVLAGLEDLAGNGLADEFVWSFTTNFNTPLIISPESPLDGAVNVDAGAKIIVVFNMPMDRAATEAAFSTEPAIDAGFAWLDAGKRLEVAARGGLKEATEYTVRISPSAKSLGGQVPDLETKWSFTTAGYRPGDGGGGGAGSVGGLGAVLASPWALLAILLLIVLVAAALVVAMARRRRRRPPHAARPWPASAQPGEWSGPAYDPGYPPPGP